MANERKELEEEAKETRQLETKLEDLEIKEDDHSEEAELDQVSKASAQKRLAKRNRPAE